MFNIRLAGDHLYGKWEMAAHLAVAGDVLFSTVFFLTRCLG